MIFKKIAILKKSEVLNGYFNFENNGIESNLPENSKKRRYKDLKRAKKSGVDDKTNETD